MRELQNAPGFEYNEDDSYTIFAEDWNELVAFVEDNQKVVPPFTFFRATTLLTNMPSGLVWLSGGATTGFEFRQNFFDLSKVKQIRLMVFPTVVGSSGSKVLVRGRSTFSTNSGNYSPILLDSVELDCPINGTPNQWADSGWKDLDSSFKTDSVNLGLMTIGGNGSADPSLAQCILLFR